MSTEPQDNGPIVSPCVGICCVDADRICIGCFRSLSELSEWGRAPDQRKREILAACARRRTGRHHV
jgi:hypothetical protein